MQDTEIRTYLTMLAESYEALQGPPVTVVLCGGAALLALNLIDRATKDIDVVGPPTLPPEFWQAAAATAAYFQLPATWINQGPLDLWGPQLPQGFHARCQPLAILPSSTRLRFLAISRLDQIHFKLYAAVDQGPSRHVQDLHRLQPTAAEVLQAAQWCLDQDTSPTFRIILRDMLRQQGWTDVVAKLD